jgi:hypothetical protein
MYKKRLEEVKAIIQQRELGAKNIWIRGRIFSRKGAKFARTEKRI